MLKLKVSANDAGRRADIYIAGSLPEFSRSSLSGLFGSGLVLSDGQPVKASYKLKAGDKLEVDTAALTAMPRAIDLPVIYEDKDVIVINKPAGVLTHSKGALSSEATVASFIKPKLNDQN